jgi:hypothetical protein
VTALVISLVAVAEVLNVADGPVVIKNQMVLPLDGTSSAGMTVLEATAPAGVTKVEFRATGGGLRNTVVAVATRWRGNRSLWLASWNASAVHPGGYTIWSVGYTGSLGTSSPPINITIRR